MMSNIRSKNTQPEIIVRKWLHSQGYRFRLHRKDLPGTPDVVLPRNRIAIFVHGCFWHHHEGCKYAYLPKTRQEWWVQKFCMNRERDRMACKRLSLLGWTVLVLWECEIRSGEFSAKLADIFAKSGAGM